MIKKHPLIIHTAEKSHRLMVDIADDMEERREGLMGRTQMPENEGMLFIFPVPNTPTFWMKNMQMSIDMIFITQDGVIVAIEKRVPPCPPEENCSHYTANEPVLYVLEVVSGFSEKHGVKVGDTVEGLI